MGSIALFRSCLRKEYRDQVIKMLRAVPGEYTRTSYNFQWIDPEVLDLIEETGPLRFTSYLVDPTLTRAFPCRTMSLVDRPIRDSQIGVYRFTFELGPYVEIPPNFNTSIAEWAGDKDRLPPSTFITPMQDDWPQLTEVGYGQSQQTWKDSITFLTESWPDFASTVFFRPHGGSYEGSPSGPHKRARQSDPVTFSFFSFNPHLSDDQLARRSVHVSIADVMGDVKNLPKIPVDGFFDVDLEFLEPGRASVQVEIRPDEQFSAYVPLSVSVDHNHSIDPSGPRILGPEWNRFLEDSARQAEKNPHEVLALFAQLATVFPGDPELAVQTGLIHYSHGQFAAARDEFAKALKSRQDSRAVWWSFLAALRLDDQKDVESLIQRLDLSRIDLFDMAVVLMADLPDQTAEWFADLPGLALGEDKAMRVLLGMLKPMRGEPASCSIVKAIGELNGQNGLRQARDLLTSNPGWGTMRRLAVDLAKQEGLYELVQDDVDLLIHYPGGPVDDYLGNVTALRPLVHPQRLPALLMSNAILLAAAAEPESLRAALTLATIAAEQAASNGDFISAQNAVQFVEMHTKDSVENSVSFREQVALIVDRMSGALKSVPGLAELGDEYLRELATELQADYEGKNIVVFGGTSPETAKLEQWRGELGVSSIKWLGWEGSAEPEANRLLENVNRDSTLIVMTLDDSLINESTRTWLRTQRVPVMRAMETKASIYGALRALAPSAQSELTFVPQSCSDAVAWAMVNCPHLAFSSRADEDIAELDQMTNWSHVAARIKQDLEMLNSFADDWLKGRVKLSFYQWAQLRGGYSDKNLAMKESKSTNENPRFRQQRTFSVPREADQSGQLYMPAHLKLPGGYPIGPRIHFSIDTLKPTGKLYIGYIGPHRENAGS